MITFHRFTLDNGLKVIVHQDNSTPLVAVNILYNVGSKDEKPDKTGFAHLFEHLMFGGSKNISRFDEPLERVGGENNAFTNNDFTNYYLTIPKSNLETAFWLESDRMYELAFSKKSLEVQRSVVSEEFKQRYLNQPYGDTWLLLRPLAYKVHPYQWSTIGKELSHITNATMEDVKAFFYKFYRPNNAVLVVAGDVTPNEIKTLAEKWFGPIPSGTPYVRNLPKEPLQTEARSLSVERQVPYDAIYKAYKMGKRTDADFHATDLLSDILSNGKSARLYQRLVKEQKVFSEINAYLTGELEEGLFVVTGKPFAGISLETAEEALMQEIELIKNNPVSAYELEKVKNKAESMFIFSQIKVLDKAMNLALFELMGDAENLNTEASKYQNVTIDSIIRQAETIFNPDRCSTLYYRAIR
jgi:zinc protease